MQTILTIGSLPAAAADAAQEFYRQWQPQILQRLSLGGDLVVHVPGAGPDHADWRRAAVRDLARASTPQRINFVSGETGFSLEATAEFLAYSPGITGQYLVLHDGG
ncbi:MAG: Rossmann fold domain-containing protein [Pontixanthobacter sp.]